MRSGKRGLAFSSGSLGPVFCGPRPWTLDAYGLSTPSVKTLSETISRYPCRVSATEQAGACVAIAARCAGRSPTNRPGRYAGHRRQAATATRASPPRAKNAARPTNRPGARRSEMGALDNRVKSIPPGCRKNHFTNFDPSFRRLNAPGLERRVTPAPIAMPHHEPMPLR